MFSGGGVASGVCMPIPTHTLTQKINKNSVKLGFREKPLPYHYNYGYTKFMPKPTDILDTFDFTRAIKECEPQAVDSLKQAMREGGPNMLKAAEIVLSYTQGKPQDNGKNGGGNGVTVNITQFALDQNGNIITSAPKPIEHNPNPVPKIIQAQYEEVTVKEEY